MKLQKRTVWKKVLLSVLLVFPLFAADVQAGDAGLLPEENEARIYDDAGLFQEADLSRIAEQIGDFRAATGMDCAVATTDNAGGKSARDYADDLYEQQGIGTGDSHDGLLYLIDLDNGEIYISTEGAALRPLTDDRLDRILDRAYEDASAGNYADSALTVLQDAQSFILEGIPEDQYNYSSETGEKDPYRQKGFPVMALLFGMTVGTATALITFFTVRSSYRLTRETYRYPLSEKSRLQLTRSENVLVNQFVTHRKIPKNPPSSGRSSSGSRTTTHRSRSGRTHGGRGRRL